ncbi:MAG: magnesium transporter [Spirochaetes bacterium]|nr:magnesium transporter [Spirochaetota bacterium]
MLDPLLVPDMKKLVEEDRTAEACAFLLSLHPVEAGEVLEGLTPTLSATLLRAMDARDGAGIFAKLPQALQVDLAGFLDGVDLARLAAVMAPDARVDFLKALPTPRRASILEALGPVERESFKFLAQYPEGCAGSIMTSDFLALSPELKVRDAILRLKAGAGKAETIHEIFVIDGQGHMTGSVELAALIAADPDAALSSVARLCPQSINAFNGREEALRKVLRYGVLSLPVVDSDEILIGVIRHRDIVAALEAKRTEEEERLMAISAGNEAVPYLNGSVWIAFGKRIGWLLVLAIAGLLAGGIIQSNRNLLAAVAALALYIPVLAGAGGNAAGQSASAVLRSLFLEELRPGDGIKVLWKEARVGLLSAALLGILVFARILLQGGNETAVPITALDLGLAIGISLVLQVFVSTIMGALLPLGAKALGLDPFLVSGPVLATIADIIGLFIYFAAARITLGI